MRGFNSLLGSHYDHYFLEYDSFDTDDISPNTFDVDSSTFFFTFINMKQIFKSLFKYLNLNIYFKYFKIIYYRFGLQCFPWAW